MIFPWNFMPPFDIHTCNTHDQCTTFRDTTTGPQLLHSRQCNQQEVQACQQHTKHNNNKSRHTAQAYYYYWHKQQEELHEAQIVNHSVYTWFSEKEKNKGRPCGSIWNWIRHTVGFILTPCWHWNFKVSVLSYHWLVVVTKSLGNLCPFLYG